MNIWKHITGQPFVFTTGLAALVHSTWTLGTLFAGAEPQPQFSPAWFAWLGPALLIAFAMDVGQIVTSAEIRAGERTRAKYLTFMVFALATYYLQWLYIAHHMPVVELAAGVRESWASVASLLRDAAVWFIPALLPMSTTLYTFSHSEPKKIASQEPAHVQPTVQPDAALSERPPLTVVTPTPEPPSPALPEPETLMLEPPLTGDETPILEPLRAVEYRYKCPDCGYSNTYSSPSGAAQGQRAHARHCKGVQQSALAFADGVSHAN